MVVRAFIAGCSGPRLLHEERAFFKESRPWGFILFKRNIEEPDETRRLVSELRHSVGYHAAVLIDQEGGRVQRLGPPHWPKYPAARRFGEIYARDKLLARECCRLNALLIARDLTALGINVDCLPVLDVPVEGAHDVIGDRAYAHRAEVVAVLGRAAAEGLLAGGVLPVIKHIPGHGRALSDSHLSLPMVEASRKSLLAHDFLPFECLADLPAAMSAHVVYRAIDPTAPATVSRRVIQSVIRRKIGFNGLLISDDLSMKALAGSYHERAAACFKAGIDIALHCNGNLEEAREVAAAAPLLAGRAKKRAQIAMARLGHRQEPFDAAELRAKLDDALGLRLP
jgi:beta-N-acetylhexosaminidase